MRRAAIGVIPTLVVALALSGCVKAKDDAPSPTRDRSLGKKATVARGAGPADTTTTLSGGRGGGSGASSTTTRPRASSGGSPPAAGTAVAAGADDASDDQGAPGPGYSDLRRVLVEADGGAARVTVTVGADLPTRLASGEVMGIGVDFYRPGQAESDYQLFADGEASGWTAYLQTPGGFVAYPGTFTLAGDHLVFTVPWTTLGDPHQGEIAAFADWSRKTLLNTVAASDKAPDTGRAPLRR